MTMTCSVSGDVGFGRVLATTVGGTANPWMSRRFADAVAQEVIEMLEGGDPIQIVVCAPDVDHIEGKSVRGALHAQLHSVDGVLDLVLPFGAVDAYSGEPLRLAYRAGGCGVNRGGNAFMASFDEAWATMCRIIELLRPRELLLRI